MVNTLYEFQNMLNEQGIFFCFNGPISQNLLTEIGVILEQRLTMEKVNRSTLVRVFSLVVEKAQNIIHYSDEKCLTEALTNGEKDLSFGIIAIGYKDDHYFVLSGNMIENTKIERVRDRLEKLQRMTKEELKEYYREQRRKDPDDLSKGAGLGFIEMARKAYRPIEFEFKKISDTMSFFSLKTTI